MILIDAKSHRGPRLAVRCENDVPMFVPLEEARKQRMCMPIPPEAIHVRAIDIQAHRVGRFEAMVRSIANIYDLPIPNNMAGIIKIDLNGMEARNVDNVMVLVAASGVLVSLDAANLHDLSHGSRTKSALALAKCFMGRHKCTCPRIRAALCAMLRDVARDDHDINTVPMPDLIKCKIKCVTIAHAMCAPMMA